MSRTHGISIAWIHEQFKSGFFRLLCESSAKMAADIFTKAFHEPKWMRACALVNVSHNNRMYEMEVTLEEINNEVQAKKEQQEGKKACPAAVTAGHASWFPPSDLVARMAFVPGTHGLSVCQLDE